MSNQWKGTNRHKYLLQFHLIFVCKYRKHLLARKNVADSMKELSRKLCEKHGVLIKYVETDRWLFLLFCWKRQRTYAERIY